MSLSANIYKLYIIKTAKWFMLIMPIIALFYIDNGLDTLAVMQLQAIYSIAIVVLEIPSGYFADMWGRKTTLIIGAILGFLGFVIYSFSYGFWGFLFAEITLGIGQSFISGSDSALLYDSLKQMKREDQYVKFEGRVLSLGNFAETIAAFIGGALAEISLRTPFIAQTAIAFIAIPAAITLVEPTREKTSKKNAISKVLSILKLSLIIDKDLRINILYSGIVGSATLSMAWLVQIYMKDVYKLSEFNIGIYWGVLNLIVGLSTLVAYKIDKKLSQLIILFFIAISVSLSYIGLGYINSLYGVGFLVLFYFARGIATPLLKDYINRLTTSDIRATVLSIRNFIIRIFFSILGPIYGWYADVFSISQTFVLAGIIYLILSIFVIAAFSVRYFKSKNS